MLAQSLDVLAAIENWSRRIICAAPVASVRIVAIAAWTPSVNIPYPAERPRWRRDRYSLVQRCCGLGLRVSRLEVLVSQNPVDLPGRLVVNGFSVQAIF